MNKYFNYILSIIISLVLLGCQEVFEPEGLDSGEKLLVVSGSMNNLNPWITVTLYLASPFNEDNYTFVNNATVWLKDDSGNSYQMLPFNLFGSYRVSTQSVGIQANRNYYIHIETSEGKVYESVPQKMPKDIVVDDMDAEIGKFKDISKNVYGDVITTTYNGLYLNMTVSSTDNNKRYARLENVAIYQSQYFVEVNAPNPLTVRCVRYSAMNSIPVVASTFASNNGQEIRNKDIGFVTYLVDNSTVTDTSTAKVPYGWIIISNTYSLAPETYNFYTQIKQQVSAENKMFDPIPTQIIGNIRCITNPSEVALGLFEIARGVRKYYAFSYYFGQDNYKKIELESYNPPSGSHCTDTVPDFDWILFN